MKKIVIFILKVSISIVLLIFLFNRIDFKRTIFYIRSVELTYLVYAFLLYIFIIFLSLIRWYVLLEIIKKDLSIWRIFVSFCGGLFFNNFLPSSIGGDIARTLDLSVHTKDTSSVFATVILDRLCGFLGLVFIALFGFFYGHFLGLMNDLRLISLIIILLIILSFVFLTLFSKKIFNFVKRIFMFKSVRDLFEKFHHSCYLFRFQKKALAKTVLLSILIQGGSCLFAYFIGVSLGIKISVIYYLIFIPVVTTIAMLPFSIGGLGLRDNAAVVLFSTVGVAADKTVAMTLLSFVFLISIGIISGGIYGSSLYNRRIQRHK